MVHACTKWLAVVAVVVLAACGPATSRELLPSAALGRNFLVQVYVPPGTTGNLPLVLALDGEYQFGAAAEAADRGIAAGRLRPFVLVGLSGEDYWVRDIDYAPAPSPPRWARGGGAGAFYDFLDQELFPHLEATQPIAPGAAQRSVLGHSLGALFGLYALFQRPGLFTGYGLSSPPPVYGDGAFLDWERSYANGNNDLAVALRLTVGSFEIVRVQAALNLLDEKLRSRAYPSLRITSSTVPGKTHEGTAGPAYELGMDHLHGIGGQP